MKKLLLFFGVLSAQFKEQLKNVITTPYGQKTQNSLHRAVKRLADEEELYRHVDLINCSFFCRKFRYVSAPV